MKSLHLKWSEIKFVDPILDPCGKEFHTLDTTLGDW
jgi:hypothetical protein